MLRIYKNSRSILKQIRFEIQRVFSCSCFFLINIYEGTPLGRIVSLSLINFISFYTWFKLCLLEEFTPIFLFILCKAKGCSGLTNRKYLCLKMWWFYYWWGICLSVKLWYTDLKILLFILEAIHVGWCKISQIVSSSKNNSKSPHNTREILKFCILCREYLLLSALNYMFIQWTVCCVLFIQK